VARILKALSGLAFAAMSAGCASPGLEVGSTNQMFELAQVPPLMHTVAAKLPKNVQLVVYEPSAVRSLDGDRVLVSRSSGEIIYLAGAVWGDRLPVLMQNRLIEALSSAGHFRGVSNGRDKVDADIGLSTTIRAFQIRAADAGNTADVTLESKLVEESGGGILATKSFSASTPVTDRSSAGHVSALNASFAQVVADIVAWSDAVRVPQRKGRLPPSIAQSAAAGG
jgi:cholesterol transport system auxiliary component